MSSLNCCTCGHFVGKDGNPDVYYDGYNGGYEAGYPTCGKCLFEKTPEAKKEIAHILKSLSTPQNNCLLQMLYRPSSHSLLTGLRTLQALETRGLVSHENGPRYPPNESIKPDADKWKLTKKGIYIAKKLAKKDRD